MQSISRNRKPLVKALSGSTTPSPQSLNRGAWIFHRHCQERISVNADVWTVEEAQGSFRVEDLDGDPQCSCGESYCRHAIAAGMLHQMRRDCAKPLGRLHEREIAVYQEILGSLDLSTPEGSLLGEMFENRIEVAQERLQDLDPSAPA